MKRVLFSIFIVLSVVLFGGAQTKACPPLLLEFLGLHSWIPLAPEEEKIRCYFLNRVYWKSSSTVSAYSIAIVPSSDLKEWIISDITNINIIDPNALRAKESQRFIDCWDISRMRSNETAQAYKNRLFQERESILTMHDKHPLKTKKNN